LGQAPLNPRKPHRPLRVVVHKRYGARLAIADEHLIEALL
jgi:hypothetical protein